MPGYIAKPPFIIGLDRGVKRAHGIIGAWPMNEPSPEIAPLDYSGYGNHCVDNSNPIPVDGGRYGYRRVYPNTTNEFHKMDSRVYLHYQKPFTVSAIVSPNTVASNDAYAMINSTTSAGDVGYYFVVGQVSGYKPVFWGNNNFGRIRITDTSVLENILENQFSVITITYDGVSATATSSYTAHVNGISYALSTSLSAGLPTAENAIGGRTGGNPFDGGVENLVIWDWKLDHNDIIAHHHNPYEIYETADDLDDWLDAISTAPVAGISPDLIGNLYSNLKGGFQ